MIITTKSGSVYTIENGAWSRNGQWVSKVWDKFCVPNSVNSLADALTCKRLPLSTGFRMYISGRDEWTLSTEIITIEGETT